MSFFVGGLDRCFRYGAGAMNPAPFFKHVILSAAKDLLFAAGKADPSLRSG